MHTHRLIVEPLTTRYLQLRFSEYPSLICRARDQGWLPALLAAHHTRCTTGEALAILGALAIPNLLVKFAPSHHAGSASKVRARRRVYRLTLPADVPPKPGRMWGSLRVGIVLHEAAHVLMHREHAAFNHGSHFQRHFERLLTAFPWRDYVAICSDYRGLYARHRGPYALILTRTEDKRVKGVDTVVRSTATQRGPFSAEDAHETARMLVTDPRDNVANAFVYSETEGQFIGAYYEKGQAIPTWDDARRADLAVAGLDNPWDGVPASHLVESAEARDETALLPDGSGESLRRMDETGASPDQLPALDADEGVPEGRPADVPEVSSRKSRREAAPVRPSLRAPRKPGVGLILDIGNAEQWPKSQGPLILRAWFEERGPAPATVADIIEGAGERLGAAGIQFPKSLISRLKQSGHLKEAE